MLRHAGLRRRHRSVAVACFLGLLAAIPAHAEDRSITIIQGAPEPGTAPKPPVGSQETPVVPPVGSTEAPIVPPVGSQETPAVPPVGSAEAPTTPPVELKAANPAGLSIEVLPKPELTLGSKVIFRVATQKSGYLILVDINADGKLTQIYPNVMSLATSATDNANLITPGHPITIPNIANPLARFEFVAEPPVGTGTVVAILSDKPVQIIDLPDIPTRLNGREAAIDYLYTIAHGLKIAPANESDKFLDPVWSFDAKLYRISEAGAAANTTLK